MARVDLGGELAGRQQHERARAAGGGGWPLAASRATSGSAKASVLPLPVRPRPRTSRPASESGSVAAWIGNGAVMPLRGEHRRRARAGTPSSAKVGRAEALSDKGVASRMRTSVAADASQPACSSRQTQGPRGPSHSTAERCRCTRSATTSVPDARREPESPPAPRWVQAGRRADPSPEETTVEYRTLGRSGCAVSTLALGTMTFGAETDEAGAHAQLDRFVEAGGTLVDTADVYSGGASRGDHRPLAGRPAGRRHATASCWRPRAASRWATGPNDVGLSRRHLRARARRVAAPARRRPRRPLPGARLRPADAAGGDAALPRRRRPRRARSRYVGLSNFTGWQLQQGRRRSPSVRGLARPVTLQPQYNLLVREIEWEIVPGRRGRRAWACCRGHRSAAAG